MLQHEIAQLDAEQFSDKQQQMRFDLDQLECCWLRSRGWKHTSSAPGSLWLWSKEIEGKNLMVDQKHALTIQINTEPYPDED